MKAKAIKKGAIDVKAVLKSLRAIRYVKEEGSDTVEGKLLWFTTAAPCKIIQGLKARGNACAHMPFDQAETVILAHLEAGCSTCIKEVGKPQKTRVTHELTGEPITYGNKEYVVFEWLPKKTKKAEAASGPQNLDDVTF